MCMIATKRLHAVPVQRRLQGAPGMYNTYSGIRRHYRSPVWWPHHSDPGLPSATRSLVWHGIRIVSEAAVAARVARVVRVCVSCVNLAASLYSQFRTRYVCMWAHQPGSRQTGRTTQYTVYIYIFIFSPLSFCGGCLSGEKAEFGHQFLSFVLTFFFYSDFGTKFPFVGMSINEQISRRTLRQQTALIAWLRELSFFPRRCFFLFFS